MTLDTLRGCGLSSDAAQHILIIEQDLATWPPTHGIDIIELDEDTLTAAMCVRLLPRFRPEFLRTRL
jgi:hypothetical protein